MDLQTIIEKKKKQRIPTGQFRVTDPMKVSSVNKLIAALGKEWRQSIIDAWRFDLPEFKKLEEMASQKDPQLKMSL